MEIGFVDVLFFNPDLVESGREVEFGKELRSCHFFDGNICSWRWVFIGNGLLVEARIIDAEPKSGGSFLGDE